MQAAMASSALQSQPCSDQANELWTASKSHSLDHGLASNGVPCARVEDGRTDGVYIQASDEGKAIDGAIGIDGHGIDKCCEAQPTPKGEGNDTGGGQQGLGSHLDLGHLSKTLCQSVHATAYLTDR